MSALLQPYASRALRSNTGDNAVQQAIWGPIFTSKDPGVGTGLGLDTAHVRHHRPSIHLGFGKDRPAEPPEPRSTPGSAGELRANDTTVVLVVEDHSEVRATVARSLTRAGFHVVEAEDGIAALEAIETRGMPDLVLTDLIMPRMGGRALGERLRSAHPELPILYMSGYADAIDAPPTGSLLRKPFRPRDLIAAVRAALSAVE